jgi:hypothetical protein
MANPGNGNGGGTETVADKVMAAIMVTGILVTMVITKSGITLENHKRKAKDGNDVELAASIMPAIWR